MKRIQKKNKPNKGFKDTFNFFMIENLKLIGEMELPYIPMYDGPIPEKIVNVLRNIKNSNQYFVHHYLYDYSFDGRNGIWYGCQEDSKRINSFINKYKKYKGIISPDFSVYVDLPVAAQIWNIYRDRVTCMWLRKQGLKVIFNVRWGDYRTYDIVFYGIEKHSTVAVGSHGLIKHPENRQIFLDGFIQMIKRIEPSCIIVYGPCLNEMRIACEEHAIKIIQFDSEQTEARKEKNL